MSTYDEINKHNEELANRINAEFAEKMGRFAAAVRQATPVTRTAPPNAPLMRDSNWWAHTMRQLRADNPNMTLEEANTVAYAMSRMPAAPASPPPAPPPARPKLLSQFCPTVELSDSAPSSAPTWNQIAKQGRFCKDGSFFSLDEKCFQEMIANFNSNPNRRIPVDFEHATEQDATAGSIPALGAPAQGWVTQLQLRGGELYGLIEWNDLARQYIKGGQYRFLSPAVRFGAKDRTTGKEVGALLSSVALTNTPFLLGMQPLAAKANGAGSDERAADAETRAYNPSWGKLATPPVTTPPAWNDGRTKRPPRLARDPDNGMVKIIDMGEIDTQDRDRLLQSIADYNAEQKKIQDGFRKWAKESGLVIDIPTEDK